jgi:hypothetical protein
VHTISEAITVEVPLWEQFKTQLGSWDYTRNFKCFMTGWSPIRGVLHVEKTEKFEGITGRSFKSAT